MKTEGIELKHFASFMEYHNRCFNEFVEYKDYRKLEEFILLCDYINYFRQHLTDTRSTMNIEAYVVEIKNFAHSFNDYCLQYGYDEEDENLIVDYTDTVLSL